MTITRLVLEMLQVSAKLQKTELHVKKNTIHAHWDGTVQLTLTHIPTWHICDQYGSDMYYTSLCDEAEQSDVSVKGCTIGVEWQIRWRGAITIATQTILRSNIPTVTHNYRHCSVQTAGRCNTPRFISSLLIELPINSMATNTDCSSRPFMSCFPSDIRLVVQTNWYYHLYFAH